MAKIKSASVAERFWEKPLQQLNAREWELLCDGCGRCCLKKFSDEDSGELLWTRIVCRYFDTASSNCQCYTQRTEKVPDCLDVRALGIEDTPWMPPTCAYRLRFENKALYDWHPLLSGSRSAMEAAGIAIAERVVSEDYVHPQGIEEHVIRWIEE